MSIFDQRGQTVGVEYNAGRDINLILKGSSDEVLRWLQQRFSAEPLVGILHQRTQAFINKLCQKPFVPRQSACQQLSEWVMQEQGGVVFLHAPAGYGKTTFLANWVNALHKEGIIAVACHFVSKDPALSDYATKPMNAFAHLLGQIAAITQTEGTFIAFPENFHERKAQLESRIADLKLAEDERLVILLDGLDEADDVFPTIIQKPLPHGVFVVASGRCDRAGDPPDYLANWLAIADRTVRLDAMDEDEIAEWLKRVGDGELHAFSDDRAFVRQLTEITDGVPLFLTFLLDDLHQAAKQNKDVWLSLAQTPKGFSAYVREQLKQLAPLVKKEQAVRTLFAVLSVAKGTLQESELEALTGLSVLDLLDLAYQVTRWWHISERTYAFSHLLLAAEFAKALGKEAEAAKQKLLAWCADWLMHKSPYALRFGVSHLADAAIQCLEDVKNGPGDVARNQEQAISYVDGIVSLLTNERFRAARTAIGLGIAAQAEDARTGIVAACVLGHRTAAATLIHILAEVRTSASSYQDLRKTVEAAVPDIEEVIRALAPFHPPEQAALAFWFAIRLDERGLADAAAKLIDWTFVNRRELLAAWPAHPFLDGIIWALVRRARVDLARRLTMSLAQARGVEHPAWSLSLYDRSTNKTDLQKAIDALTSGRLPDFVGVGDLWRMVVGRLTKHPEIQSEVMQWWLSHDYAARACSAAAHWLSEGACLEDLSITELLDALGEADDANRGRGLALLAAGVLDSAGTAQEARERLAALAAIGPVSSQAASTWMESAFWTGDVHAARAAEYIDFLLAEIGALVDDEEIRDKAASSLACEVAAHTRWAALKYGGTDGDTAASVAIYLDLLPRIEKRLGSGWQPICQAILDLTTEWGDEVPGLDSSTREVYRRARRVPTELELVELLGRLAWDEAEQVYQILNAQGTQSPLPDETVNAIYARARKRPNSIALNRLQSRLGWLYEDEPNDEYGCEWIDDWLRRGIKYGKEDDRSELGMMYGLSEELTSRGLEVKLELQRVLETCLGVFKVLPAPILLHVAEHVVRLSKDLLGWKHELGCEDLDHARTIAAIDLLELAGALPCSSARLSLRRGVDWERLRRWSPTGWTKMPARRIIQQLAGIGIAHLGTVLGSTVQRHPELASLIETLLEQTLTKESSRQDAAIAALGAGLLRAADDSQERARAVALLVEHKALDELLEEAWHTGDPTLVAPIADLLRGARERRRKLPELLGALIAHGHDAAAEEVVSEVLLLEASQADRASSDDQDQPKAESKKEQPWERAHSLWAQYAETVFAGGQLPQYIAAEMEENSFVVREAANAILGPEARNTNLVLEFLVLEPERQAAFRAELQAPAIKENWAELLASLPAGCKRSMVEPLCRAALMTARRDLADAAAEIAGSADDRRSAECVAWVMLGLGDRSAARHWATVFINRGGGISDVLGAVGALDLVAEAFAAHALAAEDPWKELAERLDRTRFSRTRFSDTGFEFPYLGISEAGALGTFLHLLADRAPLDEEDLECFWQDALLPAWFVRLPDNRAFRLGDFGWSMIERSLTAHLDALASTWVELILRWAFARVPSLPPQTNDSKSWDWLKDYLRIVGFAAGLRSQSWWDEHVSAAFFVAGHAAQELGRRSPFRWVLSGLDKAGRWGARSDYEEIVGRVARKKAYGARLAYAEYCAEAGREAEAHDAFAELLRDKDPLFLHIRAADAFSAPSDKIRYLRIALGAKNQGPEYVGQLVEAALALDQDGDQLLDELQARHSGTSSDGAIALARAHAVLKRRKSPPTYITMALDLLTKARLLIKREELPSFGFWNTGELEKLLTDKWVDVVLSALNVDALTPQEAIVVSQRIIEMALPQDLINTEVQTRLADLACRAMSAESKTAVGEMATKLLDVRLVGVKTAARLLLADTTLASDAPRRLLMKVIRTSENKDKAAREAVRALTKTAGMESAMEECYQMITSPEQALLARDDMRSARGDPPMDRVEALATHAIDGNDFRHRISSLARDMIQQMPEAPVERRTKLTRILLRYAHPRVLLSTEGSHLSTPLTNLAKLYEVPVLNDDGHVKHPCLSGRN